MIHHLSFGETYPGQVHPLDGYRDIATEDPATGEGGREGESFLFYFCVGGMMYQYFIKIVPTVYNKLSGNVSCCHVIWALDHVICTSPSSR